MKFLEFTEREGRNVILNTDHISYIYLEGEEVTIVLNTTSNAALGNVIVVQESYQNIFYALDNDD